jgi:hypothetical protein
LYYRAIKGLVGLAHDFLEENNDYPEKVISSLTHLLVCWMDSDI